MVSKLPNESLQHIFSYIEDNNTLYSIIQVNHTWCENGVKFLWRNPFLNPYENPYQHNSHLINRAKILPILIPILKQDKVFEKNRCCEQILTSDTLFYYHCFITHLDFDNLFRIVSTFFERNRKDTKYVTDFLQFRPEVNEDQEDLSSTSVGFTKNSKLEQILTIIMIFLMILSNGSANIKWLKIDLKYKDIKRLFHDNDDESDDEDLDVDEEIMEQSDIKKRDDMIIQIEESFITSLRMERARDLFTNLEYLEYGILSFKLHILEILSEVCKQLKTIKIEERYFQLIQKPLISLIKNQNHLEDIRIAGIFNNSLRSNYEETIYEIISSLKTVSHSLRKIEICGMIITHDETFSFLSKCKNLETLKLEDSYISFKNFELMALAELPKLKNLEVVNVGSNEEYVRRTNPIQEIVQNKIISINLIELVIENISIKNHNLLRVISENCRNLVNFFTIITADNDIPFLFTILKNNSRLEDLRLTLPELYVANVNTGFVIELAKSLPRFISSIYLSNLITSVNEYKEFLENCKMDGLVYYMVNFSPTNEFNNIDECEGFVKRWTEKKGKVIWDLYKHEYRKIYVVWDC